MAFDREQQTELLPAEYPRARYQQRIVNDILKLSLEPYLFTELLERILRYLVSLPTLHLAPKAAVFLYEPETQELTLQAHYGFSEHEKTQCNTITGKQCHCGEAVQTGDSLFFNLPSPLNGDQTNATSTAGHYCVPILHNDQPTGVLALYVSKIHKPSIDVEQLFESVANILATVIESQKMDMQLIELVKDLRIAIVDLREEKLFSESIIQSLNHGLIVADLEGNIIKCNNVAMQILQPFSNSLDGQNIKTLVGAEHAEKFAAIITTEGEVSDKELVLSTEDGEERILSLASGPRNDAHGRQVGFIISLTDVTELRYVRKEMEKMNRLSTVAEIASAVAHEVRNPLAGIKIMAQSIEEDAVDSEQQLECSRRIIRQVDRLNELLSEFFSYARPAEANRCPTSITAILAETLPLISNRLIKNAIDLHKDISPDLPDIFADPHQMQQVFLNLILNSIDAIRQNGTITISASLLTSNKLRHIKKQHPGLLTDEQYVMVTFADNGSGMPANVVEKAFEPFFTTKAAGTGLGLSIVYRTLHENGAVVSLESRQGKGTTFKMFFQTGA